MPEEFEQLSPNGASGKQQGEPEGEEAETPVFRNEPT
jgi:hypothetical protein